LPSWARREETAWSQDVELTPDQVREREAVAAEIADEIANELAADTALDPERPI
jgi:hypothetical protein